MIAFTDDQVRNLQFTRARRGRDDDVRKEGSEDEVHLVLLRQLFDDLNASLGVGAVVFRHDLDGPSGDAAHLLVDHLDGCGGRSLVPLAVGCSDAGPVDLEPNLQRGS